MRHGFRVLALLASLAGGYVLLSGHPVAVPGVARLCVAVLVFVAGFGVWGRRERPDEGLARARRLPEWADYAAVGAALLAVECVLLAFFSVAPRRLEGVAGVVEEWLRPGAAAAGEEAAGVARGGNWLWDERTSRPLPRRADFKPGNRPEVFLRPEDAGAVPGLMGRRLYVHAFALESYEAGVWSAPRREAQVLRAGPDGWLRLEDGQGAGVICRIFESAELAPRQPLTGLQGITAAELPELVRLGGGLHLLPPPGGDAGYEYRVASRSLTLDDLPAGAAAGTADFSGLLARPAGVLGERLGSYARAAAGEGILVQRLFRLRERLQGDFGYSLRIENAAELDPLENFLFHEKRGHCELFATAGALMARSLGVPARVVYGWSGGTYYEDSNMFVFRAREAHAWAEVLVEGAGWVVFDPTPPGALEREFAEAAPPGERLPSAEGVDGFEEAMPEPGRAENPRLALTVAGIFLVPAAAVFFWRARRRAAGAMEGDGGGHGGGSYFAAFRRACRRRGRPLARGVTLRRYLAGMEDVPDLAREIEGYHYAVRYGGAAPDPAVEKSLARRADEWR